MNRQPDLTAHVRDLIDVRRLKFNIMDIEAQFWKLCDEATRHDDSRYRRLCDDSESPDAVQLEARAYEQAMAGIIDLVEKHPEHRPTFVRCFSDLVLWKRQSPFLLVAFCMRRLRFPEILDLIARDARDHKGTACYASHMNFWSAINHAYLDEVWESAICFEFYAHKVNEVRRSAEPGSCT